MLTYDVRQKSAKVMTDAGFSCMFSSMKKQITNALLVMGVFTLLLGGIKFIQIRRAIAEHASFAPPPEAISSLVVKLELWRDIYSAVGSFAAISGATLSTQESGNVVKVGFESGSKVQKSQVLLELDSSVEQATLQGAIARLRLAKQNLVRSQNLKTQSALSLATLEEAQSRVGQAESEVQSLKAAIERKTILAPFSGRAGIRSVNVGQFVTSGTPIVPLYSLDPIYFNFSLPQQVAPLLRSIEQEAKVTVDAFPGKVFVGKITAANSNVDEVMRTVEVQATLANTNEELVPGMFGSITLELGQARQIIAIPVTSVSYAPYGNSVFVVERKRDDAAGEVTTVRQQIVQLGARRGDFVSVISGLKEGDEVVSSGVFKLRPGAAVAVNNEVAPAFTEHPVIQDT
jgi:membrane fusion protein (multidrug efflux system)